MAASDQFVEQTTSAAVEEKAKLQKHFSRFDIYFFLICTIVGVDTLGQVAANGAQGFLWLLFLAVFFFVPYALLTAELGAAFTEEGGAYIWTRMAFGRLDGGDQRHVLLVLEPDLDRRHAGTAVSCRDPGLLLQLRQRLGRRTTSSAWPSSGSRSTRRSCRSESASGSRRSGAWCRILVIGLFSDHDDRLRDQARPALPGWRQASARPGLRSSPWRRCSSSTTSASSCPTPPATR